VIPLANRWWRRDHLLRRTRASGARDAVPASEMACGDLELKPWANVKLILVMPLLEPPTCSDSLDFRMFISTMLILFSPDFRSL
jgi:hypothetical protein